MFFSGYFSSSMLWLVIRLSAATLVLNCLAHCAVPNPRTLKENPPTAKEQSHNELKSISKTKLPNPASKQTATPTVKTTRKATTKKITAPSFVDEFSLEEILFKGRQSSKKTTYSFSFSSPLYICQPAHCWEVGR